MKKVLYITNIPVPYRVEFFEELGKYVELTVAFERSSATNRNEKWLRLDSKKFKMIFMKGLPVGNEDGFCPEICHIIKKGKYDEIVMGVYHTPTAMLAIEFMKAHHIPYYFSSDGGFIKEENKIKRKFKKNLISGAKGYFSPAKFTDDYLIYYGANPANIIRYPFTSCASTMRIHEIVNKDDKSAIKKSLGIEAENMILGVGQFIYRKGWDVLIKITNTLPKNTIVCLVGGTPIEEYKKIEESLKVENILYYEFMSSDKLSIFYKAADLFVLPTREDVWGLVINEAMNYGLPIITTNKCGAGLELVEDGINGYLVEDIDTVKGSNMLEEKMNELIQDKDKRKAFAKASLRKIEDYSIETMADTYARVLK